MNKNFKDNGSWFDELFVPVEEASGEPLWERQRSIPVKLLTEGFTLATAIAPVSPILYSSWSKTSYIGSSSALYVFGDGAYGLHMNPIATNESSIVASSTLITWKDVTLTDRFFIGVSTDNKLYSCGYRYYGSLGNGSYDPNITSVLSQVGTATDWNYASVGGKHTALLKTNGTLYATGDNAYGQLGDGATTAVSTPIQIGSSSSWTQVASGYDFNIGLNSGKLFTWGRNDYGQLGDGTTTNVSTPIQIGTGDWTRISAKGNFWNAIKSDGSLWTCGVSSSSPVQVGSSTDWIYNAQGFAVIAGIRGATGSGSLWAWSNGGSPIQIGTAENWTKVYCGVGIAAINTASEMFVWGENTSGQLGLGTEITTSSPVQIAGSWNLFASAETSSLFVNTSGYLFGAGSNWFGQRITPPKTQLSALIFVNEVKSLASGKYHTLFVKPNGTLWAAGLNVYGQCGTSQVDEIYSAPVRLDNATNWASVACTFDSSYAIKTDGSVFVFGRNQYGQLGLGDTVNRSSLVQLGTGKSWNIFAGTNSCFGVSGALSGTLWAWGSNTYGQLGIGTTTNSSSPVQIGADATWTFVGSNDFSMSAIKAAGTLWGAGGTSYSMFGTWSTSDTSTPIQLGSATNWSRVVPSPYEFQYLTTTGQRWTARISPTMLGSNNWGDVKYVAINTTELATSYIGYIP